MSGPQNDNFQNQLEFGMQSPGSRNTEKEYDQEIQTTNNPPSYASNSDSSLKDQDKQSILFILQIPKQEL